ncbi:hypothetical protein HDV05_000129 [Chytridiales sp. JEL 0842]|nr:hypothetical protein HDV05_000129 [Chytridiales sp. JEL 0842]
MAATSSLRPPCDWNKILPYDVSEHERSFLHEIKTGFALAVVTGDFIVGCQKWTKKLNAKYLRAAISFTKQARRFFAPGATLEILEELLPDISPHNVSHAFNIMSMLNLFLPTDVAPEMPPGLPSDAPAFYWVPTVFTIWSYFANVTTMDIAIIDLLARLAEAQIGTPEQVRWTDEQVKTVFAQGLRLLGLPVGSGNGGTGGRTLKLNSKVGDLFDGKSEMEAFARFVVSTIYCEASSGITTNTMHHIKALIHGTEGFFNPSNTGKWSMKLGLLINCLSSEFLKRWRKGTAFVTFDILSALTLVVTENSQYCQYDAKYKLTPEICSQFVSTLRNVTFLAIFGKDPRAVSLSIGCLKNLAILEPSLIIPGLLDRAYPALETLTQTHRMQSCISALGALTAPMFKRTSYPAGARHLLPLLNLSLLGIDMNDLMKTTSTLMFVTTALMSIPIVDLTNAGPSRAPDDMEIGDEEDNEAIRYSTGEFESWLPLFLDRVWSMLENLPQQHGSTSGPSMEGSVIRMATAAIDVTVNQLSPALHKVAVRKISNLVSTNVIPNATKAMGYLVSVSGGSDPMLKLDAFIPLTVQRIKSELENGASSIPSNLQTSFPFGFASLSDASLHWNQIAFISALQGSGSALLKYSKDISESIEAQITMCKSQRGVKWAAKSLKVVLNALTMVYPAEARCVEEEKWADPEFIKKSHLYWGNEGSAYDLKMKWHVPSEPEIDFAVSLIESHLPQCINQLRTLIQTPLQQDDSSRSADHRRGIAFEFLRWITVLINIIRGMSAMLPPNADTSELLPSRALPPHAPPNVITDPYLKPSHPSFARLQQLRMEVGNLLVDLTDHLLSSREDDINSLKMLAKAIEAFVTNRGVVANQLATALNGYNFAKSTISAVENEKKLPRYLLIKKVAAIHLSRLRLAFSNTPLTVQVASLINCLANLSVSRYAQVRIISQQLLSQTVLPFTSMKTSINEMMISKLLEPAPPEHVIKGALHVLDNYIFLEVTLKSWPLANRLARALTKYYSDDPGIQELVRVVHQNYADKIYALPIELHPAESLFSKVPSSVPVDTALATLSHQLVEESRVANNSSYHDVINYLITGGSSHWRVVAMGKTLLDMYIQDKHPISLSLVNQLLKGLVEEHPTVRALALRTMTRVFRYLKARARKAGLDRTRALSRNEKMTSTGKEFAAQYLSASTATAQWGSADFHDSVIVGWFCWPTEMKLYRQAPASFDIINDDPLLSLPYYDPDSKEALMAIYTALSSTELWEKLSAYHCQESSNSRESFNLQFSRFINVMANQFEDRFNETCIRPVVESLLKDPADKSKQRAGVEILAGLLRGSKHWSEAKMAKLWAWTLPLITSGLQSSTAESLKYWVEFLNNISGNRDPRRIMPVVQLIFSNKLDPTSQSFFSESKKLYFMKVLLSAFSWRLHSLLIPQLRMFLACIRNPYKQVRETLGSTISEVVQLLWYPSTSLLESIGNSIRSEGSLKLSSEVHCMPGVVPLLLVPEVDGLIKKVLVDMEEWRAVQRESNIIPTDYCHASKTVLSWLFDSMLRSTLVGTFSATQLLMPEVFKMINYDDNDLQQSLSAVLSVYPLTPHTQDLTPKVINLLLTSMANNSVSPSPDAKWHVKTKLLPILQVFYFRHLHLISKEVGVHVLESVAAMLEDPQIEVRNLAAVTLSGLIRCSQRDALGSLKVRFEAQLRATKSAKKKIAGTTTDQGKLITRHAAVLGLTALVAAFPYEVPEWMPDVLIVLSSCLQDQAPIKSTVTKAFADFRRTHQDTWQDDMNVFTEDQRSLLSDLLISESYYA